MANPITLAQLIDAREDATSLSLFVNADATTQVPRRLAPAVETLEYWRNYMSTLAKGRDATIESLTVATGAAGTAASVVTGGTSLARTFALTIPRGDKGVDGSFSQKAYTTYTAMDADKVNIPANTSVSVTNDTDTAKNGMYAYNGTAFTKSAYDPLTQSKSYTDTAKADTLTKVQNVFATKELMTASTLPDGSSAVVNSDATASNNGFYKKTAGVWAISTYEPLAQAKLYTNQQFTTVTIGNMYQATQILTDLYVNGTGGVVAGASSKIVVIELEEGKTYAVEYSTYSSSFSLMAFSTTSSIVAGNALTSGTLQSTGTTTPNVKTFTVPTGKRFAVLNIKFSTSWDSTSKFIINEGSSITSTVTPTTKELVSAYGGTVTDKEVRGRVDYIESDYLSNTTLITEAQHNLLEFEINGYYLNTAGGFVAQGISKAVAILVVAGETYAITANDVRPDYLQVHTANSLDTTKTVGALVTLVDTADEKIKTFTVPIDATYKYLVMNMVVASTTNTITFDVTTSLVVNKGSTITDRLAFNRVVTTIRGNELQDAEARQRISIIETADSNLRSKKWVAIGDSITQLNNTATKPYHAAISDSVGGMTVVNMGVGGDGYYNKYNVADTVTVTDADFYTVMYGTNDYALSTVPLGVLGDTTTATVAGCIHLTLTQLRTKLYDRKLAVITSIPRSASYGVINPSKNGLGFSLYDVAEIVKKTAANLSIPVLDLYASSNLSPWIPAANTFYFASADGVHPNNAGHAVMAAKIKDLLVSISL